MQDLNKVTLVGDVARSPRTRRGVTRFSLATDHAWEQDHVKRAAVDLHEVAAFGKLGDIITSYINKGARLYVEGRLCSESHLAGAETGRSATVIVADNIIMLGHRTGAGGAQLVREQVEPEEEGEA